MKNTKFKRELTSAEVNLLYNKGNSLHYKENDLFETITEIARPEPSKVFTITAFVGTKKKQHDFIVGASAAYIQSFLIETYGKNCWSWE